MRKFVVLMFFSISTFSFAQVVKDRVFLVDRSIKDGKVIKIDETQIIFEDNAKPGMESSLRLSIIWKIIYSNGFEEVFNQPLPESVVISNQKQKEKKETIISGITEKLTGKMPSFQINPEWRPMVSVDLSASLPIILSPEEWTSTDQGLALRLGLGGEIGFTFNPLKYFGVSVSQGFVRFASFLPDDPNPDADNSVREMVLMTSLPTSFKINLYPKKEIVASAGLLTSGLSITNSNPQLEKERLNGYVLGLGKLFYFGESKNYWNLSFNYTSMSSSAPFQFNLDNQKFPDLGALKLDFKSLNLVELKFSLHYGLKK